MELNKWLTNQEILEVIGHRVRSIRISKKMTQKSLALQAGVTTLTISKIEQGHLGTTDTLLKILRVLDLIKGLELLFPIQEYGSIEDVKKASKITEKKRFRKVSLK